MDLYILKNKKPVRVKDVIEWGKWFEKAGRHIDKTYINKGKKNEILISTVFLGIDHNYFGGKPLLYETMIFGGINDQYQERYYTYKEAEEGHKKAVELVKFEQKGARNATNKKASNPKKKKKSASKMRKMP